MTYKRDRDEAGKHHFLTSKRDRGEAGEHLFLTSKRDRDEAGEHLFLTAKQDRDERVTCLFQTLFHLFLRSLEFVTTLCIRRRNVLLPVNDAKNSYLVCALNTKNNYLVCALSTNFLKRLLWRPADCPQFRAEYVGIWGLFLMQVNLAFPA